MTAQVDVLESIEATLAKWAANRSDDVAVSVVMRRIVICRRKPQEIEDFFTTARDRRGDLYIQGAVECLQWLMRRSRHARFDIEDDAQDPNRTVIHCTAPFYAIPRSVEEIERVLMSYDGSLQSRGAFDAVTWLFGGLPLTTPGLRDSGPVGPQNEIASRRMQSLGILPKADDER